MIIASFDPSLRNWGMALASYSPQQLLTVLSVDVIKTKPHKQSVHSKAVQDLQDAQTLIQGALGYANQADVVVIELPIGSQSAAAMKSYGICIGITACLHELNIPFYYVSPYEVKSVVGSKETTKEEIITWVNNKHPGHLSKYKNSAEHQADAIVAIYAALPKLSP